MAVTTSCYTYNIIQVAICVVLIFLLAFTKESFSDLRPSGVSFNHEKGIVFSNGDVIIDALLPIHTMSPNGTCTEIYTNGLVLLEAIVFAVKEIHRLKILPGAIKFGYEIRDTCNSVVVAQRHTLDVVLQTTKYTENVKYEDTLNRKRVKLLAVIGAGNSEISIAVNRVLSAFNIPQIGFASTSRYLSDKIRFPSFFRTVPPDSIQVKALISLFKTFSWNYAAILFSDHDYGRPLAQAFKNMAKQQGICIGFEGVITHGANFSKNIDTFIRKLKTEEKLDVIVILVLERKMEHILKSMLKNKFVNKTLIASDSWSFSTRRFGGQFKQILRGTLGFAHRYVPVKKFDEYFRGLKPNIKTKNPWFNETWERLFNCKLHSNKITSETLNKQIMGCDVKQQRLRKELFSKYHYVPHVINAVFAVAHGVRKYCQSLSKLDSSCYSSINPKTLMEHLTEMKFRGYDGTDIEFNRNGDVPGEYDFINIQSNLDTRIVGVWKGENGGLLTPNISEIIWNSVQQTSPNGICAQSCLPGWFKAPSKKNPQCCWKCQACSEGMISNQSNALACEPCGDTRETNSNRTKCVTTPVDYLNWRNALTVTVAVIALIAILLLIFVVIVFIRFANTPVVKSSNRELSLLLCLGLFVTFLVPYTFAGKPTPVKCTISQTMFCVGTALALSAMLFKTLRIVLVFEYSRRKWFLENKYEVALTIAFTSLELIYCLLWVAINPPGVQIVSIRHYKRYMVCDFEKYWYAGSNLLLILLSFICTGLAIRGRKLPKNFNEMKHITLSMFTFNIVWLVFVGAQYGASVEYDTRINCLAMIISSLMILSLLFGPKVFVLLFRPHLNRPEEFQEEVKRYSFQKSNVNIHDTGATRSSGTPSIASSMRDLPNIGFSHPSNLPTTKLLTVPNRSNFKRKRAHTFDIAMAPHSVNLQNRIYQSLELVSSKANLQPNRPSNEKNYDMFSKQTSPDNHKYLDDLLSFQKKHCRLCNQTLKRKFSSSMPNIFPRIGDQSDIIISADIHEEKTKYQSKENDSAKNSNDPSDIGQNIPVQENDQGMANNEGACSETSSLLDNQDQQPIEKEKESNNFWKNLDTKTTKTNFKNKSERETAL